MILAILLLKAHAFLCTRRLISVLIVSRFQVVVFESDSTISLAVRRGAFPQHRHHFPLPSDIFGSLFMAAPFNVTHVTLFDVTLVTLRVKRIRGFSQRIFLHRLQCRYEGLVQRQSRERESCVAVGRADKHLLHAILEKELTDVGTQVALVGIGVESAVAARLSFLKQTVRPLPTQRPDECIRSGSNCLQISSSGLSLTLPRTIRCTCR